MPYLLPQWDLFWSTAIAPPPLLHLAVDDGLDYSPDDVVVSNGAKQTTWHPLFHSLL